MRSVWYSSAIGFALLSGVLTHPLVPTDGSSCEVVTVTEVVTEYPTATSTPAPEPTTCRPPWESRAVAPSVDRLRAGLIFVDFADTPADHFGQEPSQLYEPLEKQPTDLYRQMSFGKLDFEIVPLLDKFYRMPNTSAAYGFADDEGLTAAEHTQYISDALTAVGDAFDFTGVDILFIAPPSGTDEINRSASYSSAITTPSGHEFLAGTVITFGNDLYAEGAWNTVNHETGHAMGLPDLYPYGPGGNGLWAGSFDLMGIVWGQSPDFFAWHKWRLSWIEENQVDCVTEAGTTTHRLSPIEVDGGVKAVAIPVNSTGYVMAEVRSTQGVDHAACESATGVLLYTADTAVGSGEGPIRVIDTNPETSGCDSEANGAALNDAPLREVDATFDTQLGVKVTIISQDGDDYIIEVEREASW